MPVFGYLGAWDDQSLEDFRKAARISGPSRVIITRLYNNARFGHERSPWKDKFKIPSDEAMKEAQELFEIRLKMEEKTA